MPKQSKSKSKAQTTKTKNKVQPEPLGITTSKWYWVMLTGVMVTVFSVVGYIMNLGIANTAVLLLTITLLIGLIGYVRITPSNLPVSKRATFLFIGASVIGFGAWAAIVLVATNAGFIESIFVDPFFIIPSVILCMIIGAFIGELLSKNSRIQALLFKP
ncbi:MAG: hypothetical protein FWD52_04305 [Candidatus Bathyarchaeota archaeon]|nr:hypothetical protein [Candidatus Termiticorpusculum sp.]